MAMKANNNSFWDMGGRVAVYEPGTTSFYMYMYIANNAVCCRQRRTTAFRKRAYMEAFVLRAKRARHNKAFWFFSKQTDNDT